LKYCKDCKQFKSLDCFTANRQKKDGLNIYCRMCCNKRSIHWKNGNKSKTAAYKKRYRELNPTEARDYTLRSRYGITLDEFNAMFEKQGKRCAVCRSDKSDSKNFVVDHCHTTGKIRGVLCSYCNRALGMMKDDPELLSKAIIYLRGL